MNGQVGFRCPEGPDGIDRKSVQDLYPEMIFGRSEPETPVERKYRRIRQNNQTRTFINNRAKSIKRGRGRR